MSDEDKAREAERLQEERASHITKKVDEVLFGKSLDGYLKERWMLSFIKDAGCPFIYDMMMYKQIFAFLLSFVSLFFIGSWGFLLMVVFASGLFIWEFFDRLRISRNLIREMAGHDNAANLLQIFISSYYTEGMSEFQLKHFREHTKMMAEVRGRLEVLDRAEKANKAIKNDKEHRAKKEDLLEMRKKLNKQQPFFVMLFCLHMHKGLATKLISIR